MPRLRVFVHRTIDKMRVLESTDVDINLEPYSSTDVVHASGRTYTHYPLRHIYITQQSWDLDWENKEQILDSAESHPGPMCMVGGEVVVSCQYKGVHYVRLSRQCI